MRTSGPEGPKRTVRMAEPTSTEDALKASIRIDAPGAIGDSPRQVLGWAEDRPEIIAWRRDAQGRATGQFPDPIPGRRPAYVQLVALPGC